MEDGEEKQATDHTQIAFDKNGFPAEVTGAEHSPC